MRVYKVKYQVGTYSGVVEVTADENEDYQVIIAKAKRIVYRHGSIGMCYESFKIIE